MKPRDCPDRQQVDPSRRPPQGETAARIGAFLLGGIVDRSVRDEAIRRLRIHGEPLSVIGELFGLTRQRIDQILNAQKERARQKTKTAIANDTLSKPEKCERCGGGGELEAHHHDYSKPLDVEFLCRDCHVDSHSSNQSTERKRWVRKEVKKGTIGARVRERRLELRMTQRELADAVGMKYPHLSRIETGVTENPSASMVGSLAEALCCSADWLILGGTDHLERDIFDTS